MGKEKQSVKERKCSKCGETFQMNAADIKEHAQTCEPS
jgi:hypothetical protein